MNYSKSPGREVLYQFYIVEGLSQPALAAKLKRGERTVRRWLANAGISGHSQTGQSNPNFKHGLACGTFQYRRLRDRYLPQVCENCGATEKLVAHHKNNDHYDNSVLNLAILCVRCHSSEHARMWWAAKKSGQPYLKSNGALGWNR